MKPSTVIDRRYRETSAAEDSGGYQLNFHSVILRV